MTPHPFLDDDLRNRAALYVLGLLDETEARSLRLHLALCSCCRAEVEALLPVSRVLCLLYPAEAPPPELWTRVVARIGQPDPPSARGCEHEGPPDLGHQFGARHATPRPSGLDADARAGARPRGQCSSSEAARTQVWKAWAQSSAPTPLLDFTFVSGTAGEWETTAIEGVEARRLFVDADGDRATFLVRMRPGAAYPAHVHAGPEECFVLEGDLLVGHQRMRAGDYQRAESGSTHDVQSTEGGCVLLLVSSLGDEIVE